MFAIQVRRRARAQSPGSFLAPGTYGSCQKDLPRKPGSSAQSLTARESHEEEELLPELLQREKSLVAFENVIVTWDPRSGFIA